MGFMVFMFGFIIIGFFCLEGDFFVLEVVVIIVIVIEVVVVIIMIIIMFIIEVVMVVVMIVIMVVEIVMVIIVIIIVVIVVVMGFGEVKMNWFVVDVSVVELFESVFGIIDGVERDIGEVFGMVIFFVDVVSMYEYREKGVR